MLENQIRNLSNPIWVFAPISTKTDSTSLPFHLHNNYCYSLPK